MRAVRPVFFSEWLQAGESRGLRQQRFACDDGTAGAVACEMDSVAM